MSVGNFMARAVSCSPVRIALASLLLLIGAPASAMVAVENFRHVFREHQPELIACYEASSSRSEPLVRLSLRVQLAPDGHVMQVDVDPSTSADAGLQTCVTNAVRTWAFPATNHGTITINYPLIFTPG
jgi:hypothetical protein